MEEKKATDIQPEEKSEEKENQNEYTKQMDEILENIEGLLESKNITNSNKKFIQYTSNWKKLVEATESIDPLLLTKFETLTDQFKKNYDWALWANYKIKEEICKELENILKNKEKKQLIDSFDSLRKKWKVTGNVPAEKSKEQWEYYRELCKKVHEKTIAFFEDNLQTKIVLCKTIENLTNPDNWQKAASFVKESQKNWNTIGPVLRKDSDEIWKRFQAACNQFFTNQKIYYKELKKQQKEHLSKKRELCQIVESFSDSIEWKETSTKIHEIQKQWKTIGSAGKKHESTVWKRFKAACDTFFDKQKEYFKQINEQRPINLQKKEELCKKLENMGSLSDEKKYEIIIETQNRWKEIGPVPKEMEKEIWDRFRKPIDSYFNSRKVIYEKEKKDYEKNLQLKEILCEEAEKLMTSTAWQTTRDKFIELQKKWNQIGKIPRDKEKKTWNRFKTACDTFFDSFKEYRSEMKHELQDNLNKKIDLCFQAESIAGLEVDPKNAEERAQWQLEKLSENFWFKITEDESWEAKATKIKELQKTWKQIGPVPKNRSREIWERFQKACNSFFQNKNHS